MEYPGHPIWLGFSFHHTAVIELQWFSGLNAAGAQGYCE
jgi:hypothetical protein